MPGGLPDPSLHLRQSRGPGKREVLEAQTEPARFRHAGEQNTHPRTTYEALVRNPNPAIKGSAHERYASIARPAAMTDWRGAERVQPTQARASTIRWSIPSVTLGLDDRSHLRDRAARTGLRLVVDRLRALHGADALLRGRDPISSMRASAFGASDWPVMWGFAILSYVWWIAIASGGTIISALFFLVRAEWRDSINRIAESMMLFGAAAAGIYPILHLGRPWFFYWLFFYPNTMTLWAQFRSPLLWDFWALFTYVMASVLFWYFGLDPGSWRACATGRRTPRQAADLRRPRLRFSRHRAGSGNTCARPTA